MRKIFSILLLLVLSFQLHAQETYVFFGSYNWDKNKPGIYVYELNQKTGKLSKVTEAKGIYNPSFITLSPNGKFLYACTDTKTPVGSVSSFSFNPKEKELIFLNSQPSGGENPVYVSVHKSGKWLANANYNDGSLSVFPLSEDGKIQPSVQNIKYTSEGSVNPKRLDHSHVHSAVFSHDFKNIYFPDLGSDKIRSFQFKENEKEPLVLPETFVKTEAGFGPRHLSFHPNGKVGYAIGELSGELNVYDYNSGKLDLIQKIKTHPDDLTEGFESSDVHVSPDGKFLYATNRGKENNIAIFSVAKNGTLKSIGYQSVLGKHPRTFAIDPSGNFLIVTNVNSSDAVVFRRNLKTGLLEKTDSVSMENVTCVQIQKY